MKSERDIVQLSDVCTITSALVDPRKPQYMDMFHVGGANIETATGKLFDLKSAKQEELKSGKFVFDETMVLYSKIRPYLMKVARPEFEGLCSADIYPLSPKRDRLCRGYLFYLLLTTEFTEFAISGSARAGMPKVNRDHLFTFTFQLPPLPEQQQIVGILDEALYGIATAKANAEKNLQNARALFESHLQTVFTQGGEGWVEKRLGDVCELFQGLAINVKSKHLLVSYSSLPLIRIKDLRNNSIEQYVAESGYPPNTRVEESEIIYTRTGQIGLVFRGRSGVLHNNCFKVKPKPILTDDYLFWWLQHPEFRNRIITLASKAAQPDIPHSIFKVQPILVPPLEFQKKVSHIIIKLDEETQRLESIYRQKLVALEELKKSLLHQAFTGNL
jgi:restriction endonuclease S subunit